MCEKKVPEQLWREVMSFSFPADPNRKYSLHIAHSFREWLHHRRPGTLFTRGELHIEIDSKGRPLMAIFSGSVEITAENEPTYKEFVNRWLTSGREGILCELLQRVKARKCDVYSETFPPQASLSKSRDDAPKCDVIYSANYEIKVISPASNIATA